MNFLLLHDQCLQFPAASRFVLLQVGHPLTLSRAMKAAVHAIKHAKEEVRNEGFRLACACHACMGRTLTDEALLEKKEIEYGAGTTFVAKIPPQLGVEADEFTPRHTSTELDEKIRKLEAGDTEDAEAEIELAEIERDAAKQFVAHGSDFQNHMLWRFMRDSSGAIMTDAKGVAIR